MRIGLNVTAGAETTVDGFLGQVKPAEEQGFSSVWTANIFGFDAINLLALAGRETSRIELGTAVVPTFPRHPLAIAQQALTTQAAAGGRFTLGIGLSHKVVIENMLGLSYTKTARHMREYLSVLMPLVSGQPAKFEGEQYRVNAGLQVAGANQVPVVVAALGSRMLEVTGEMADGTITWMTGPKTLESHIIPTIRRAASVAGRPEPRIIAGILISLTNDPEGGKAKASEGLKIYGTLPSYRAMLDREGAELPGDISIVGDEKALEAGLKRLEDIGVTDYAAALYPTDDGAVERTREFLVSRL
ncbi:MAG: TIGR03564 family F420-dependent LLM class oxidoreductase [Dehalococcoidia bacterium]|nr:TIGR03564 family F420-dependent LLM class oxidoreductase [Dehalococcoidia bacterium]